MRPPQQNFQMVKIMFSIYFTIIIAIVACSDDKVLNGDVGYGKTLYYSKCLSCHNFNEVEGNKAISL
jgi:hypothetical protein